MSLKKKKILTLSSHSPEETISKDVKVMMMMTMTMTFTERGLWARHYTEWLMYIVQLLLTTSHETGILPWFDGKIRLA